MYDAIVIGARCGGAATAMLLARAGLEVLLVDRAVIGSNIPHGHFIHRHGPARLAAWGLLDAVLETNCPAVTTMTTDLGDFPLVGEELAADGAPLGIAPRRDRLDRLLAEAAVAAGAELRDRFAVVDYVVEGARVTGIVGRDARSGARATELARIVIGADGRNSGLARRVGAELRESAPAATCWYFSYWGGVPCPGLELYAREGRIVFLFPTNDGLVGVFVGFPIAELRRVRADIEGEMLATIASIPQLAERIGAGRREERLYGATHLPNFVRKPYGPGWALVGDAGCHKDPYMALGICDALRDAELLAGAVIEGCAGTGGGDVDGEALAGYERERNAQTMPEYHVNLAVAQLGPPLTERHRRLRAALRGDAAATRHFYLAVQGMVARQTFFNDENIERIIGAARARAGAS